MLLLFVLARTAYAFFIGAPILYTPKKAIRDGLNFCGVKAGDKFYDLGAGSGRSMVIAAKEFGAVPTGFELSPIFFALTKLNLIFSGVRSYDLRMDNFYAQSLDEADCVFCFLTPKAMKKLAPKFAAELTSGAKIISYGFQLPDRQPDKIINNGYPGNVFCYTVE
ncbi:MAG: hypothetical protein P4L62_02110 [Candidatus Pacebacteria bacterium]|nr:hypothetical protein [Candidatus Paceibacterota bacterium]